MCCSVFAFLCEVLSLRQWLEFVTRTKMQMIKLKNKQMYFGYKIVQKEILKDKNNLKY